MLVTLHATVNMRQIAGSPRLVLTIMNQPSKHPLEVVCWTKEVGIQLDPVPQTFKQKDEDW